MALVYVSVSLAPFPGWGGERLGSMIRLRHFLGKVGLE